MGYDFTKKRLCSVKLGTWVSDVEDVAVKGCRAQRRGGSELTTHWAAQTQTMKSIAADNVSLTESPTSASQLANPLTYRNLNVNIIAIAKAALRIDAVHLLSICLSVCVYQLRKTSTQHKTRFSQKLSNLEL